MQGELIDVLIHAGASAGAAMVSALAHREIAAASRLLERGAAVTPLVAACLGRTEALARLLPGAGADERQAALAGAALHGQAQALSMLIGCVDLNAYSPAGFHAHGTALHHAVDSGSLDAVKVLAGAGADPSTKDLVFQGTPLDWAVHLQREEIAAYLREEKGHPAR